MAHELARDSRASSRAGGYQGTVAEIGGTGQLWWAVPAQLEPKLFELKWLEPIWLRSCYAFRCPIGKVLGGVALNLVGAGQ